MTYTLSIGSVSSGTMRTEDLLDSFDWEIRQIAKADPADETAGKWIADYDAIEDFDSDEAADLLEEAFDILNEHCPPYCYFGSHEGDGSDYGCWPSMGAIEDLPHVADPSDLDDLDEDEAVFVNDHGNVTLYARNEAGEWRDVWAIV